MRLCFVQSINFWVILLVSIDVVFLCVCMLCVCVYNAVGVMYFECMLICML